MSERPSLDDPEVYRMLVEGIPAIVYVDEPDELSTNFYTSPQAVELLGYTQEEWATVPDLWVSNMHPDDRERVLEDHRLSNERLDRFFCEYRMLAKDGHLVWIRDEATLVADSAGRPLYWRGLDARCHGREAGRGEAPHEPRGSAHDGAAAPGAGASPGRRAG